MRNIKRKEEGVSPVIATILMVAITVVLAATLYMMLPSGSETDTTEAMSGRLSNTGDGYWIVAIDSGSVSYSADKVMLYNKSSGASDSATGNSQPLSISFGEGDGASADIQFNDNDNNNNINGGDTFRISALDSMSADYLEDNYQLRIEGTSLQVNLG